MTLEAIGEIRAINALIKTFSRHPDQVNRPHESDAEIIGLGPERWLAATTDAVTAEITQGLYQDPYTAGWVLVMANLSDLAAVGASPIGLLNALNLPPTWDESSRCRLTNGMTDAAHRLGVHILGGDLNEAPAPVLSACAMGLIEGAPVVTRIGIKPGDTIYATRRMGLGNAFATAFLTGQAEVAGMIEKLFRPVARLAEGQQLRPWVTAMMDGSDGLMSTLDHLARLNAIGWEIDLTDQIFDPEALRFMRVMNRPAWALACGEHGDYELFFTVSQAQHPAFIEAVADWAWTPIPLGRATEAPGIRIHQPGRPVVTFEGSFVRNLLEHKGGDWRAFVEAFWAYGEELGLTKTDNEDTES